MILRDYKISVNNPQSPLACYNELRPYREGKEEINYGICLSFLWRTNNPKVIGCMLDIMARQLKSFPQNYMRYRYILLGCLIGRECREDNLQKIAAIQNQFGNLQNGFVPDYILTAVLANRLQCDKTAELKEISKQIPNEYIVELQKEINHLNKSAQIQAKQQKILKQAERQAEGKEVWKTSCTNDKGCEVTQEIDLERFGSIKFPENAERIYIYNPIPQTSNLAELKKIFTFWPEKVDLTNYVIKLPECTEYIILGEIKAPTELDLSHLKSLKSFHASKTDFTNTKSIVFPYGQGLDELMLFHIENFPNDFDLSVLSFVSRYRTDCQFKESDNSRLPKKIGTLELAQLTAEQGIIDFSSIESADYVRFEKAILGKDVEIRFPQNVKLITFEDNSVFLPKRLNLDIEGLEEVIFCDSIQKHLKELILPKNIDHKKVKLPSIPDLKVYYGEPDKPNLWQKLFSKTR